MTKTARRVAPAVTGALLATLWSVVGGSAAAADSLLVGNFNGQQSSVLQYDATTGVSGGAFVPANTAVNGGLDFPLGGAFGPDGNFYVSNSDKDNVLRYNGTTGAFLNTFVNADDSAGLAFRNGNLYVAISQPTGAVERFNGTTGASLNPFVTPGSGGLSNPEGFAFGRDGNLYVGSNDDGKVRRYNGTTGAFIDVFASGAAGARGVAFGPDGNLYVTNFGGGDVLRFNGTTGAFIDKFVTDDTTKNGGLGSLPRPLVFGPDGNLYVGDYGNGSVLRYNGTTGAFIDAFAGPGSGGLVGPTFLVFSGQNATPVPEPGTLVLLGSGLTGLLAGFAWKRGGQGRSRRE